MGGAGAGSVLKPAPTEEWRAYWRGGGAEAYRAALERMEGPEATAAPATLASGGAPTAPAPDRMDKNDREARVLPPHSGFASVRDGRLRPVYLRVARATHCEPAADQFGLSAPTRGAQGAPSLGFVLPKRIG